MGTYFILDRGYWTDPDFENCPPMGRMLYLYLGSNRHCNLIGLYTLSALRVMSETGLTAPQLLAGTKALTELQKIEVQDGRYWIRAYLGRQKNLEQDMFFKGVVTEAMSLPDDPMTRRFFDRYKTIFRSHPTGRKYTEADQKRLLAMLERFEGPTKDQQRPLQAPSKVPNANANANDSSLNSSDQESIANPGPISIQERIPILTPEEIILAYWLERVQAKYGDHRTVRAQTLTNIRACLKAHDQYDLIAAVANYATEMDAKFQSENGRDPYPVKGSNFFGRAGVFAEYLPKPEEKDAIRERVEAVIVRLTGGRP